MTGAVGATGTAGAAGTEGATGEVSALIVAHGVPSAPEPPDAEVKALAGAVARALAGTGRGARIEGATLALEGALEAAVRAVSPADGGGAPLLVYPFFMASGWFVTEALPARLAAAGAGPVRVLAPLGEDPRLGELAVARAREGLAAAGLDGAGTVVCAAHGSPRSRAPAAAARAIADRIAREAGALRVTLGFVDETPGIAEAARAAGSGICLPLFVATGSHVAEDVPEALAAAGFSGPVLAPIGSDRAVPSIIAASLIAAAEAAPSETPSETPGQAAREPAR